MDIWGPALEAELEFRRTEVMAGVDRRRSRRARGADRVSRRHGRSPVGAAGTAGTTGSAGTTGTAGATTVRHGVVARTNDAVRGACGWVLRRSGAWHVAR